MVVMQVDPHQIAALIGSMAELEEQLERDKKRGVWRDERA